MKNKNLAINIHKYYISMHVHCNVVTKFINLLYNVPGYEEEGLFDEDDIDNILSLSKIEKYHRVIHDNEREDGEFIVQKILES